MGIEALKSLIPAVYALAMLSGYLMNDMLREYLNSGEFNRRGRIKDALWAALMFYGPLLIIGLVILVSTRPCPSLFHACALPFAHIIP